MARRTDNLKNLPRPTRQFRAAWQQRPSCLAMRKPVEVTVVRRRKASHLLYTSIRPSVGRPDRSFFAYSIHQAGWYDVSVLPDQIVERVFEGRVMV